MKIVWILLLVLFIQSIAIGQTNRHKEKYRFIDFEAITKFALPEGYLNDFEHLFTTEQKQELDSIIKTFEISTSNQICIVSIESYEPYSTLRDFTTDLGNYWGVGDQLTNNGLMITISKSKRNIWIGTGLGTEEILTNEIVTDVINTKIIPYFKEGKYFDGVKSGLLELIEQWE